MINTLAPPPFSIRVYRTLSRAINSRFFGIKTVNSGNITKVIVKYRIFKMKWGAQKIKSAGRINSILILKMYSKHGHFHQFKLKITSPSRNGSASKITNALFFVEIKNNCPKFDNARNKYLCGALSLLQKC